MSWRDHLLPAQFKDVPFHVLNTSTVFGRRSIVHEFPMKDIPFVEDLGGLSERFTISAFVIQKPSNGLDYFTERNNLMSVLREAGPGTLHHPFLGIMTVSVVDDVELTENFTEGGIARFRITFTATSELAIYPLMTADGIQSVDTQFDTGMDILEENFADIYEPDGVPSWSEESLIDAVTGYFTMARDTLRNVHNAVASTISTGLRYLSTQEALVSSIISAPADLSSTIKNGFDAFLGIVGLFEEDFAQITDFDATEDVTKDLIKSVVTALVALKDFGLQEDNTETGLTETRTPSIYGGKVETITINTSNTARQAANRIATTNMIRAMAILAACKVAVRGEYTSFDETIDVLNEIVNAIDEILLKLGAEVNHQTFFAYDINIANDTLYGMVEDVRPVIIKAMRAIGAELAEVIDYTVGSGVENTLVLAYSRYEDVDRATEIFNRNVGLIEHPGFLPNQEVIEILNE